MKRRPRPLVLTVLVAAFSLGAAAVIGDDPEGAIRQETPVRLGPKDGHDLPPTDLERVAVGTPAPDFSLEALSGDTVTLSDFRGKKNVVLVFYRGFW